MLSCALGLGVVPVAGHLGAFRQALDDLLAGAGADSHVEGRCRHRVDFAGRTSLSAVPCPCEVRFGGCGGV